MNTVDDLSLAVVGLGYVGLPLAVEFGKIRPVVGFDINPSRIAALRAGNDTTREVFSDELSSAVHLTFSENPQTMARCNTYIVAVPTPIDVQKKPDFTPLTSATETVARLLRTGDIVIFESTVFPGATEEICVPILERLSGLKLNEGFYVGYSPERINPGDKSHRLTSICKVTSGSTPQVAEVIDALYASIVTAGTYRAPSIKVAEAAKVIENVQRDVNIALVNELAIIFRKLGIDTEAVLQAAGTKWNFLPFRPGLVGGHCIGVDPYYLIHKAQEIGHASEMILVGRNINDNMGSYVASEMVKAMLRKNIALVGARVLIMGFTFKENCPDIRNTRVIHVVMALKDYGVSCDVTDPYADPDEARKEYGIDLVESGADAQYDGIILTVPHAPYTELKASEIRRFGRPNHVFYDMKSVYALNESDLRL